MAYHSKGIFAMHNGDVAFRRGDVRSEVYWNMQAVRWFAKAEQLPRDKISTDFMEGMGDFHRS